jgi:hypothetical protein
MSSKRRKREAPIKSRMTEPKEQVWMRRLVKKKKGRRVRTRR